MVSQLDLHTRRTYLVDYDLGQSNMSGLDFFKLFKSPQNLVLVTGHFDEPGIQESCAEIGCKLLSKDAIFQIEIIWLSLFGDNPNNCVDHSHSYLDSIQNW